MILEVDSLRTRPLALNSFIAFSKLFIASSCSFTFSIISLFSFFTLLNDLMVSDLCSENFDKRYLNASLLAKNQSPIAKSFHLLQTNLYIK